MYKIFGIRGFHNVKKSLIYGLWLKDFNTDGVEISMVQKKSWLSVRKKCIVPLKYK